MAIDCRAEKQALRKLMKERLSVLDSAQVSAQSQAAQESVMQLKQYREAQGVSIYMAMPHGELQTEQLIRHALQSGKEVFVPYLSKLPAVEGQKPVKIMDMLRLNTEEEYSNLKRDAWGIPSLTDGIDARENAIGGVGPSKDMLQTGDGALDMIIVPGVAFDGEMRRLGHGAGYYDSYFARYTANVSREEPFLVGLCLAEQFLRADEVVPTTEHDWDVDLVIAGDAAINPRAA